MENLVAEKSGKEGPKTWENATKQHGCFVADATFSDNMLSLLVIFDFYLFLQ